jgi:hypothetical protein
MTDHELRIRATAYHEAGHAVCSLVLRGQSAGAAVHVEGNLIGGISGADDLEAPPDPAEYTEQATAAHIEGRSFKTCFDSAVVFESGHAANFILNGGAAYMPFPVSHGDRNFIEALAREAFRDCDDQTVQAFANLAGKRAIALLWPRWAGVVAVAEALIERRILSASEVAGLFADGLQNNSLMHERDV